jgi:4-hydroxybenzoate polyprenyltransferase
MIILLPVLFELFALMNEPGGLFRVIIVPLKENLLYSTLFFTAITFLITLIREIVGDMQDEEGDRECGCRSLVIVLGESRTKSVIYVLSFIFIALTLWFLITNYKSTTLIICILIVCIPMLFFIKELRKAKSIQDYGFLSELLKIVFVSGLFMMTNIF